MDPYWEDTDAGIALYLGDMREVLPALDLQADLLLADGSAGVAASTELKLCTNCGAGAKSLRRTWCRPCYLRWFKAGKDPDALPPPVKNDSLQQWRQVPEIEIGREPSDLDVGTAGEHLVCADLLLSGLTAFRTDQNCAYDIAVDLGGRLIRLQVKSTRSARVRQQRSDSSPTYRWHVRRAGKGGRRNYGDDEFDLLALVALDIRQTAYVPPSLKRTIFDVQAPGTSNGKQFSDYSFTRALFEIGAVS